MTSVALPGPALVGRFLRRPETGIFIALVVMIVLISIFQPVFFSSMNVYQVSRQIAYTAIVALGVFFVILTGGIDLSLGSTVGLSGFVCGLLLAGHWNIPVALLAGLATGALIGAVNGFIISFIGVTSFIVTLGMLGVGRSLVLVMRNGDSVRGIPRPFVAAANGECLHMPVPLCVLIAVAILSHISLKHTVFGRRVFAIGGNEEATHLSGINTRKVKFFTYVISGLFCSITGILFVARFKSATADAGKGMELDAIAAAVIGGTSLMGGRGSVIGVLIGASLMGVVRNGLVLMQVPPYWQDLIIGAIIIAAAILDVIRNRRSVR